MANEGFIKLYRKMLEWGWYDDGPTKDVFIHLLLIASYEDKFYRGILLERGQVVTTVKEMEVKLGLTTRQIRTALSKLISTNEVTKKSVDYSIPHLSENVKPTTFFAVLLETQNSLPSMPLWRS